MRFAHMNGRIYDPTLGRMLQADPFVPNKYYLHDLQGLETRYKPEESSTYLQKLKAFLSCHQGP